MIKKVITEPKVGLARNEVRSVEVEPVRTDGVVA